METYRYGVLFMGVDAGPAIAEVGSTAGATGDAAENTPTVPTAVATPEIASQPISALPDINSSNPVLSTSELKGPNAESPMPSIPDLTEAIKNDLRYQQILQQESDLLQKEGKPQDTELLNLRALAKYRQEKDNATTGEKDTLKPKETESAESRLAKLENQLSGIKLENGLLKAELVKFAATMKDILPMIQVLLLDYKERETEPKKKETLAQLLIKILGIIASSTAIETVKTAAPPLGQGG